jgi:hypothetical protein
MKLAVSVGAVVGLLTSAHAKESLLTNHGEVLACSDQPAPGTPLFTTFGSSFSNFTAIADDGTVLFLTNLAGPMIDQWNNRALFGGTTNATLALVAQWDDPAPDLPGLHLANNAGGQGIKEQRMAPDGRVIFTSRLTNDTRNLSSSVDTAIFGGFPGSFSLIAREGSLAPGTAGAMYTDFANLSNQYMYVIRNGQISFPTGLQGGDVVGPTNDFAIYGGTIGAPVLAVREGQTMLPGPVTASAFSGQAVLDNNGRILYNLTLAGPGVTAANDESLWLWTPGSGNTMLVREGDPAPGTAGGTFNNGANDWQPAVSLNGFTRNGKYAIVTEMLGGNVVPGVNDRAIYMGQTGGGLTLVVRAGDPAPGTDGVFAWFHTAFTYIADSGRVAFQGGAAGGTVTTANDTGIWAGTPGALTLVAREGSPAPGTDGARFDNLAGWAMSYSDFGIVFNGNLLGGDVVRTNNNRTLHGWAPAKGTFLAARSGDSVEVSPGVFKTTSLFGSWHWGNTDGGSEGLTNGGKLAVTEFFTVATSGTAVASVDLNCAPATDYYLDADGDGHGDPATETNLCTGIAPPPGYITTAGDCLDSNPGALGASPETCNGLDDDCDTLVDEGIPIPTASPNISVNKGSGAIAILSWPAVPGATAYDIVTGDLTQLRTAHTFQFLSSGACVGDDETGPTFSANVPVNPGSGIWWVMRPLNCDGDGSYGSGAAKERPGRDAEINSTVPPSYACQ